MTDIVRVLEIEYSHRWMETRFPFQYGIASMTRLPHLFLKAKLQVNGAVIDGLSSEGLPPKWFTKNPKTLFEEDLPEMLAAIEHAAKTAVALGEKESVFGFWNVLYREQDAWSKSEGLPPLLAHLGTSLIERAVIDGFCRAKGKPFCVLLRENGLGMDLGRIHSELKGMDVKDFLPDVPLECIAIRHTVGLGDPLTKNEISAEDQIDDGLPHSLEESIDCYGLLYFKVKIRGDLEVDVARLKQIASLLARKVPGARITFDGNEQFRDIAQFREHWEAYIREPELEFLLDPTCLLFVEQPLHRDFALLDSVGAALAEWPEAPPIIIDESDGELSSLPRALELGYRGTSHKNCKGVFKGIANRCLLRWKQEQSPEGGPWVMSGEDLANVGPVALLNDLSVMASLGIDHVERNGHHYFAGLSMYPKGMQERVLTQHSDVYKSSEIGFPTLRIHNGMLGIRTITEAAFGCSLDDWEHLGEPGMPQSE
jgi:hypothetical protein